MPDVLDTLFDLKLLAREWTSTTTANFQHRLRQRAKGEPVPWAEIDVARVFENCSTLFERAAVAEFATAAMIAPPFDRLYLLSLSEYERRTLSPSAARARQRPDLLLVECETEQLEAPKPRAVIELKFRAQVNGRFGYCTSETGHHSPYSNQLICYPGGCVHPEINAADGVRFLWVSPNDAVTGGLNDRDAADSRFGAAFARQQAAKRHWRSLSWADYAVGMQARLVALGVEPALAQTLVHLTSRVRARPRARN